MSDDPQSKRLTELLNMQRALVYLEQFLLQVDPDALIANGVKPEIIDATEEGVEDTNERARRFEK
eukprot:gene9514-11274_t